LRSAEQTCFACELSHAEAASLDLLLCKPERDSGIDHAPHDSQYIQPDECLFGDNNLAHSSFEESSARAQTCRDSRAQPKHLL
jgi:hypothetical protein